MQYAPTLTDQKIDSLLKPPTPNDPFFVYLCRSVCHTPHKCPWPWANESHTRYVSIKYVLIESFSQKRLDSLSIIESFSRQKSDSPLKPPTHNDTFSVYRCRGVWHTPPKCPWQWANESPTRYVSVKYVLIESYTRQKLDSPLKPPTHNTPFLGYRCRGVSYTPHKCPWQLANESPTRYVSIKYVFIESFSRKGLDSPHPFESYTRQKLDSPLKSPTRNDPFSVYRCRGVLHTPHKCPWPWANESPTRYVSIQYVFIESYSHQKLDSPLKSPTRKDPFLGYRCRGVWHTPHKYPWQWANDSSTRYVSVEYVFIESFSRKWLDSPYPIKSYSHQKLDSPLKQPARNDPFSVYRCRGVLHTPHKCPWQWANDSPTRYVSIKYVLIESFSRKGLDSPYPIKSYSRQKLDSPLKPLTHNDPFSVYRCRGVLHTPHKRPRQGMNESICHPFFEYT